MTIEGAAAAPTDGEHELDGAGGLVARDLRKSYGAVAALRGLSLHVVPGEIHGLLGGNGSGKSTLAKVLVGLVAADSGEVTFDGRPLRVGSPADGYRFGVASTFQELSLLPNLSVQDNLMLGHLPGKVFKSRARIAGMATRVLELVGLAGTIRLDQSVADLSQNERYMVELAKAILWEPRLLIVDEITSALYRENVATVMAVLRRLASDGVSVVFIGHRMSEILDVCDRVSVLRNGRITATFATADVDEDRLLAEMVGGVVADGTGPIASPLHVEKASSAAGVRPTGAPLISLESFRVPRHRGTVTLAAEPGQIVGLAGLQGQGQSELLRAIFGLAGDVEYRVAGERVRVSSVRQAVRLGIAYISGDRREEGTFAVRSLQENVAVARDLVLRQPPSNAQQYLTELGVVFETARQPISSLSGGNQQKVVFGRWLQTAPRVLLADDATKGVDVRARRDLHGLLRRLAARGSTVIFASSDEEEIVEAVRSAPAGSVVHVIYDGAITASFDGATVTVDELIEASLPTSRMEA